MKDACILSIKLKLSDGVYKLASVLRAKDKSIYIAFPVSGIAQSIDKGIKNIKFSYHPTGKNHMKMKQGDNTESVLSPEKPTLDKIRGIMPTNFVMSFFDINTINHNTLMLDKSASKHKYDTLFEIDAKEYKDLTINFFLAKKGFFDIDKVKESYMQILVINLGDIEFIATTKDVWLGKKQVAQQSI